LYRVILKEADVLKNSEVEQILKLVEESDFQQFRLQLGDMKIELLRKGAAAAVSEKHETRGTETPVAAQAADTGLPVPAPMLGVYWHAPRPGDPPFVKVGDTIGPDKIIGIIEVMKLMNTVTAGVSGTVTELVASNGKGVEFGQTLIRVKP
jgi:acetyl-CoA carboxylase biotin carboxyl carrier protein